MSKGNANQCSIIPTTEPTYEGNASFHYNKDGKVSEDIFRRNKKALPAFSLSAQQHQSQTIQLSFIRPHTTFWYMTKRKGVVNGPFHYDFTAEHDRDTTGKRKYVFINIDLTEKLSCSCFSYYDRPSRCNNTPPVKIILLP